MIHLKEIWVWACGVEHESFLIAPLILKDGTKLQYADICCPCGVKAVKYQELTSTEDKTE